MQDSPTEMIRFYHVATRTCRSCEETIGGVLKKRSEISDFFFTEKLLTVAYKTYSSTIEENVRQDIDDIGYSTEITENNPDIIKQLNAKSIREYLYKGLFSLLPGLALFIFSMLHIPLPTIAAYVIITLSGVIILYVGKGIFYAAYKGLMNKKLNMDTLFSISTVISWLASVLAIFIPAIHFHMVLSAPLMLLGFRRLGQMIQQKTRQEVTSELNLRDRVPRKIKLVSEKKEEKSGPSPLNKNEYPIDKLVAGDRIFIPAGGIVPVDGNCMTPEAKIDQHIITGRHNAVNAKEIMEQLGELKAGMTAITGIKLQVNQPEHQSHLAKLQDWTLEAQRKKTPIEKTTDKILHYFVPTILLIASVAAVSVGFLLEDIFLALYVFIALLVASCPCILGIIVPLAIIIGIQKASMRGIRFNDSKAMNFSQNTIFGFDLHGTLTCGQKQVISTDFPKIEEEREEILSCVNALEETKKTHAIAKGIQHYIKKTHPAIAIPQLIELDETVSNGVQGTLGNFIYTIGDSKLMADQHISIPKIILSDPTQQVIYVARKTLLQEDKNSSAAEETAKIVGHFVLQDTLRPDAIKVVNYLNSKCKGEVHVVTGSVKEIALAYANLLHIPSENVHSECTLSPEERKNNIAQEQKKVTADKNNLVFTYPKVKKLLEWKKDGAQVAFIGDALNDEGALGIADCPVVVASESGDKEIQAGRIVIVGDSLQPLLTLCEVSEQTRDTIAKSLWFSLIYNIVAVSAPVALLLIIDYSLDPGLEAAFMIFQALLVFLNAWLFKQQALATDKMNPSDHLPDSDLTATSPQEQKFFSTYAHS